MGCHKYIPKNISDIKFYQLKIFLSRDNFYKDIL